MIESIQFTNFKAIRKATLPLSPLTLLLGPNGSGKSSVLQALANVATMSTEKSNHPNWRKHRNVVESDTPINIRIRLRRNSAVETIDFSEGTRAILEHNAAAHSWLAGMRFFNLDAAEIAKPSPITPDPKLLANGGGFAAVADLLHCRHPENWSAFLDEFRHWLPEFDNLIFGTESSHQRSFSLRTKIGQHEIPAAELSQGTLVALALLVLAHLPKPPTLIGLEEIDRGLHPRLLRRLQDALYRLSHPESCGEKRLPVQILATTHSPYLLDLFRDHPEEVVLAEKKGLEVAFRRLSDIEHFDEIMGDAPLSEVWYSGVLGGVPAQP